MVPRLYSYVHTLLVKGSAFSLLWTSWLLVAAFTASVFSLFVFPGTTHGMVHIAFMGFAFAAVSVFFYVQQPPIVSRAYRVWLSTLAVVLLVLALSFRGGLSIDEVWGFVGGHSTIIAFVLYAVSVCAGFALSHSLEALRTFVAGFLASMALASFVYTGSFLFASEQLFSGVETTFSFLLLFGFAAAVSLFVAFNGSVERRRRLAAGIVAAVISLSLLVSIFAELAPEKSRLVQIELRPTVGTTFQIGLQTFIESPLHALVGTGAHSFTYVWDRHMPPEIAQTDLWNTSFTSGGSLLITLAIEVGVPLTLGFVLLVLLSAALFFARKHLGDRYKKAFGSAWVSVVLGGFVCALVYAPSAVFMSFVCIAGGVVIGLLFQGDDNERSLLGRLCRTRAALMARILVISSIGIGGLVMYGAVFHFWALTAYDEGVVILRDKPDAFNVSIKPFEDSITYAKSSFGLRAVARAHAQAGTALFEKAQGEHGITNEEHERAAAHIDAAIGFADQAREANPDDYRVYVSSGETLFLRSLITRDADYAERALEHFQNAEERAPNRPFPAFLHARALFALERFDEARMQVEHVLTLRPEYENAQNLLNAIDIAQSSPAQPSAPGDVIK